MRLSVFGFAFMGQRGLCIAGLLASVIAAQVAADGTCPVEWDGEVGQPGMQAGTVLVLTGFDDGSGEALYAGGWLPDAGGEAVNHIAQWDGDAWHSLDGGMNGSVASLAVFDDGSGPALYAGGSFTTAGGEDVDHIARWDGSSWSALSGGGTSGSVFALTVFDDGSGPALYVGGFFETAGEVTVNGIARWNGEQWSALGSGSGMGYGNVRALEVFDDGSGPALYAGGIFEVADGLPASRIAKWDGQAWSALGTGISGSLEPDAPVYSLAVFDDDSGAGSALYVGGLFDTAGDVPVNNIARWRDGQWSAVGGGTSGSHPAVRALAVFDDGAGSGSALYAGGDFTSAEALDVNYIASWDGSAWSPLAGGLETEAAPVVGALTVMEQGSGADAVLYVGGSFHTAGDEQALGMARWGCQPLIFVDSFESSD